MHQDVEAAQTSLQDRILPGMAVKCGEKALEIVQVGEVIGGDTGFCAASVKYINGKFGIAALIEEGLVNWLPDSAPARDTLLRAIDMPRLEHRSERGVLWVRLRDDAREFLVKLFYGVARPDECWQL